MARVYVESYGCSLNFSEGEAMAGLLAKEGHEIAKSPEGADAVIVNMCSVKTPTERKILKRVRAIHGEQKELPIVVAGCLPVDGRKKIGAISEEISLVNTQNMHQIGEAIDTALEGGTVRLLTKDKQPKLGLPKVRKNPVVSIVPISSGCDLACTYCVTTIIKGKLWSYPAKDIRDEIARDIEAGCREFWLTSQDNGAYYTDRVDKCMLPDLMNGIAELEGDFRVRVGMTNPVYLPPVMDELLDAFENEKFFKFLHLPIQAGSDRILDEMKREYTVKDFLTVAQAFRERFPDSTLSSDIICGFPGETEEEFEATLDILRKVQPDVLNISRYWPRVGTMAARREDQIHWSQTKERSRAATRLFEEISLQRCQRWIGWQGRALVDETGKPGTMIARNDAYRPIVVEGGQELLGRFVEVKVKKAGPHYLVADII